MLSGGAASPGGYDNRDLTRFLRLVISARSCSSSEASVEVATEMDGMDTSMILSASCARSLRTTVSVAEARTLAGKCWRNSCRRRESSMGLSPNNCCIHCSCRQVLRRSTATVASSVRTRRCARSAAPSACRTASLPGASE